MSSATVQRCRLTRHRVRVQHVRVFERAREGGPGRHSPEADWSDGLGVAAAFEANTAQACELHRHILGVNKELVQLLRRLKSKPLPKMARS